MLTHLKIPKILQKCEQTNVTKHKTHTSFLVGCSEAVIRTTNDSIRIAAKYNVYIYIYEMLLVWVSRMKNVPCSWHRCKSEPNPSGFKGSFGNVTETLKGVSATANLKCWLLMSQQFYAENVTFCDILPRPNLDFFILLLIIPLNG